MIQDLSFPIPILLPVGYNDAVQNLMDEALDLATIAANPGLSSALAALAFALNAIPDLGLATAAQLASVVVPLLNAQSVVAGAISSTSGFLFS